MSPFSLPKEGRPTSGRPHEKVTETKSPLGNGSARPFEELGVCGLISNRRSCTVEFRNVYRERFVIRLGTTLQDTERYRLTQQHSPIIRAAEVDAGVDSVTKADVKRHFAQF